MNTQTTAGFAAVLAAVAALFGRSAAPAEPTAAMFTAVPQMSAAERPHTLSGTLRRHDKFHSAFLPTDRDVLVYLPPGYDDPKNAGRRYPVLYLHDGQNVFDSATSFIPGPDGEWHADEAAERLIAAGVIEPLLIVGVYNAGAERANEYSLTHDPSFGANGGGGKADLYGRLLVEELKPFIDRTYRTKMGPQDTGLGGSSFGGLATLAIGLDHSDVFGKLAVVSPSVWWDRLAIVRRVRKVTNKPATRVYLDMGTNEGRAESARRNLDNARLLRRALEAKGWDAGRDLMYVEAEGAEHNEKAWAARFPAMLTYLFPAQR